MFEIHQLNLENKSESYKFLMSQNQSNLIIPGLGLVKPESLFKSGSGPVYKNINSDVNGIPNSFADRLDITSFEEGEEDDEFLIKDSDWESNFKNTEAVVLQLSDNVACELLENGSSDVSSKDNEYFSFISHQEAQARSNKSSKKLSQSKTRKSSLTKSSSETVCWDNALKDTKDSVKESEDNSTEHTAEWNYFSLRRTCFRGMSAYYKDRFNAFRKQSKNILSGKSEDMVDLVSRFIKHEFSKNTCYKSSISKPEFLDSMITVLHSHRHKKNESYIKGRDFKKIRQVLYSFSTSAKKIFLSDKNYALVFEHFHNIQGNEFVNVKSNSKPAKFRSELELEFGSLLKLATKTLSSD